MMKNYYQTLGIKPDASLDEIKRAYKTRAKELHPDRRVHLFVAGSGNLTGSRQRFQELVEAYETLRTPGRRQHYDRLLERQYKSRARHKPKISNDNAQVAPKNELSWRAFVDWLLEPLYSKAKQEETYKQ